MDLCNAKVYLELFSTLIPMCHASRRKNGQCWFLVYHYGNLIKGPLNNSLQSYYVVIATGH